VFGSPAKSLRLQVCHIFCNPRSQSLCCTSAPVAVCLHTSKPLIHSAHKSIHFSATLQNFIHLSFSMQRQKNAPNLRAYCRGRSRASSSFVTALLSPLRSTRSRLARTGSNSLRCYYSLFYLLFIIHN
jgi:hypothetical protein